MIEKYKLTKMYWNVLKLNKNIEKNRVLDKNLLDSIKSTLTMNSEIILHRYVIWNYILTYNVSADKIENLRNLTILVYRYRILEPNKVQ